MHPLAPRDPEEINGHRLLGRLGEGGQGVVYLAEAPDGRRVAVKVMHGVLDRTFAREVAAAHKVAPFCTAQVIDSGDDYVITEFIDGPSLRDAVVQDGPMNGAALYRLSVGTATALAAIHQAGIVHRDFKPGNVLLGPDGPRVIDFGIARNLDATASVSGSIVGTPSFMAPEQFSTRAVTAAADIFSWAATIAYAANGSPPYGQDSIPAVMHRLLTAEPDLGRIDEPLRGLLARCLAREPAERPSARDVLTSLLDGSDGSDALAVGRSIAAEAPLDDDRTVRWTALRTTPHTQPPPRRRSRRIPRVATAAAAFLLTAGTGFVALQMMETEEKAVVPYNAETPPTNNLDFADVIEAAVAEARTATIKIEGGRPESLERLEADGRLDDRKGQKTSYEVSVHNPVDPGDGVRPRHLILAGDTAYPQEIGGEPIAADASAYHQGDPHLDLLLETRWVSSPRTLTALLRAPKSFTFSKDQATWTLNGESSKKRLAMNKEIGAFYGVYDTVSFTLLLDSGYQPKSLALNLRMKVDGGEVYRSFYKVTYGGWGSSGTIAIPR